MEKHTPTLVVVLVVLIHSVSSCSYYGVEYQIGDKFPSTDGCNQCVCGAVGVVCTKMMCLPTITKAPGKSCTQIVGGVEQTYADGQSYKSSDGCNTCTCQNGNSMCTLMACATDMSCTDPKTGQVYNAGSSFKALDGCNTCNCFNGVLSCTEMFCPTNGGECFDQITGRLYSSGTAFDAPDGCNSCICQSGVISCTKKNCINGA